MSVDWFTPGKTIGRKEEYGLSNVQFIRDFRPLEMLDETFGPGSKYPKKCSQEKMNIVVRLIDLFFTQNSKEKWRNHGKTNRSFISFGI